MGSPRRIKVTPGDRASLRAAAALLGEGELVVVPTDTVYGVAADPGAVGAEEKIYRAKARDVGKPLPILAADIEDITGYGAVFTDLETKLAKAFWPGPLTLILDAGGISEGFRIPDHEIMLSLLRESGGLLRVTSANVSGGKPALTADEAIESLGSSVALVLDAGPAPGGAPSTVVKVEGEEIVVLRQGAISGDELERRRDA